MTTYRVRENGRTGTVVERERFGGILRLFYWDDVNPYVPQGYGMVVFHVNGAREVVR